MRKEDLEFNLVQIEHKMLDKWKNEELIHKIIKKNESGKRFRFLDGPITANNRAGIHHFWGRIIKDIVLKYNAMQGKSIHYQNGFDAQGMWVEVNTERAIGLNGKPDILNYGLDNFTNLCISRVDYFAKEITDQSIRMGQFMDWENSYITNSKENMTSIWAVLKKCDENGWIVRKNRPIVWCPRCGTSISEHELSGSYHDVEHTALYVKFPAKNKDFSFVAWTTTPWTLTANAALAVNPKLEYVLVKNKKTGEKLVFGKERLGKIKGDFEVLETLVGEGLVGLEYETCFPHLQVQNFTHKVIPWKEVASEEGSGIVHIAPGCGVEDFELGKEFNLPEINPINEQGIITQEFDFLNGVSTVGASAVVEEYLLKENKLLYSHAYTHSYPYCWRCKTDLVYKLISTWYITMDELRPRLLRAIDEVEFQPAYAKKRMIDWLENMGDWNISRSRFYGLALPFYICDKCGKTHVIGSMEELRERAVKPEEVDNLESLHRPWIDAIKIKCDCGQHVERVPEVGDCWLDAGITPFSTKKYFTDKEFFENNFPSDFVCEMIEQVKLWFYSTLVMSVVLEDTAPYKKIVTYQYVRDENGDEFHKSGGNSLDADVVANEVGAESVRYLYAGANPVYDMRFGIGLADEAKRKLLSLWNVFVFFASYYNIDLPNIKDHEPSFESLRTIDKWLVERTKAFAQIAERAYEEQKSYNVIKEFEAFIDDVSNFYIRSNRKIFWSKNAKDKLNSYRVLYDAIKTTVRIMAPILPFITEHIWLTVVKQVEPSEVESVHLSSYPNFNTACNEAILDQITKVRDIIYVAQKLRSESNLKVKQPLNTLYLKLTPDYAVAVSMLEDLILDELNIKQIKHVTQNNVFNKEVAVLDFRAAGSVLKNQVNTYKNALTDLDDKQLERVVAQIKAGGEVLLPNLAPQSAELFKVTNVSKEGFVVDTIADNVVALDTLITQELLNEGALRELVRNIQVLRKNSGYEIQDRIVLSIVADNKDFQHVVAQAREHIMDETLANDITALSEYDAKEIFTINDIKVEISVKKA